jgi:hypothetical protein
VFVDLKATPKGCACRRDCGLYRIEDKRPINETRIATMPKPPKSTTEPPTASNRPTQQEIEELWENVRQMSEEIRAKRAARKRQEEAE